MDELWTLEILSSTEGRFTDLERAAGVVFCVWQEQTWISMRKSLLQADLGTIMRERTLSPLFGTNQI